MKSKQQLQSGQGFNVQDGKEMSVRLVCRTFSHRCLEDLDLSFVFFFFVNPFFKLRKRPQESINLPPNRAPEGADTCSQQPRGEMIRCLSSGEWRHVRTRMWSHKPDGWEAIGCREATEKRHRWLVGRSCLCCCILAVFRRRDPPICTKTSLPNAEPGQYYPEKMILLVVLFQWDKDQQQFHKAVQIRRCFFSSFQTLWTKSSHAIKKFFR